MITNPYLIFDGTCAEAFKFYATTLGGKIEMLITYADAPPGEPVPPNMSGKIMHARVTIGDTIIMGGDAPPTFYQAPQGLWVAITVETPEEADRIYAALSEGGTIKMPIGETFWAKRFAMFVDKFSIPWMISCEKTPA